MFVLFALVSANRSIHKASGTAGTAGQRPVRQSSCVECASPSAIPLLNPTPFVLSSTPPLSFYILLLCPLRLCFASKPHQSHLFPPLHLQVPPGHQLSRCPSPFPLPTPFGRGIVEMGHGCSRRSALTGRSRAFRASLPAPHPQRLPDAEHRRRRFHPLLPENVMSEWLNPGRHEDPELPPQPHPFAQAHVGQGDLLAWSRSFLKSSLPCSANNNHHSASLFPERGWAQQY